MLLVKYRWLILIMAFVVVGLAINFNYNTQKQNTFYENLNNLNVLELQSEAIKAQSLEYYDLALQDYDLSNYDDVINNCLLSREYSSDYTQKLREMRLYSQQHKGKLFEINVELLNAEIQIENNRYEACEYIESASRQYANEDYFGGDQNIDYHNEKIQSHDDWVEVYNTILARYTYELKKEGEVNSG